MLKLEIPEIVAVLERQLYSLPTTHELARFQIGEDTFVCVVCGTDKEKYDMRNVGQFVLCEPCAAAVKRALDAAPTTHPFQPFYLLNTLRQVAEFPDDEGRSERRMSREERIVHHFRNGSSEEWVPEDDVLEEPAENADAAPLSAASRAVSPPPLPEVAPRVIHDEEAKRLATAGADVEETAVHGTSPHAIDFEPGIELPSREEIARAASVAELDEFKRRLDAANTELHRGYDEEALKYLAIYRQLGELYIHWRHRLREVDLQEFLRVEAARGERKARRQVPRFATM